MIGGIINGIVGCECLSGRIQGRSSRRRRNVSALPKFARGRPLMKSIVSNLTDSGAPPLALSEGEPSAKAADECPLIGVKQT